MTTRAERDPVRTLSGRPRISRLGVWDPDAALSQAEVIEQLGMAGNPFATAVFEAAAVDRRHLSISGEALDRSFQGRASHGQDRLSEDAVTTIDALDIAPAEIGTMVVASLYSLGVPTLAQR